MAKKQIVYNNNLNLVNENPLSHIKLSDEELNSYTNQGIDTPDESGFEQSSRGFKGDSSYDEGIIRDSNQDQLRANNQGIGGEIGNALGRIIPKALVGVAGTIGTIGDLENVGGALGVIETDYTNWLTDYTNKIKEGIDEALPIYEKEPGKTFSATDSAWWVKNIGGVLESAAEFGITGFGLGAATSALSKGLIATKYAKGLGTLVGDANQFTSALALTHAEGVMTGADVFKQTDNWNKENLVYDNINQKIVNKNEISSTEGFGYRPITDEESYGLASDAAATSVRLNYANVALNISSLSPIFKSKHLSREVIKNELKQEFGETSEQLLKRIKDLDYKKITKYDALKHLAQEVPQEMLEEGINVIAQNKGLAKGNVISEDDATIYNSLFSEEGLVAMGLGAVGSAAQTGILKGFGAIMGNSDKIKEENTFNLQKQQIIDNIGTKGLDYIKRVSNIKQLQNEVAALELVRANPDATVEQLADVDKLQELAKEKLLSEVSYHNFQLGTTQSLLDHVEELQKKTDEQIIEENKTDNTFKKEDIAEYRTKLADTHSTILENEKVFNTIQKRYDTLDGGYKKDLFSIKTTKNNFQKQKLKLETERLNLLTKLQLANPNTTNKPIDYNLTLKENEERLNKINEDYNKEIESNPELTEITKRLKDVTDVVNTLNAKEAKLESNEFLNKRKKDNTAKAEKAKNNETATKQREENAKNVAKDKADLEALKAEQEERKEEKERLTKEEEKKTLNEQDDVLLDELIQKEENTKVINVHIEDIKNKINEIKEHKFKIQETLKYLESSLEDNAKKILEQEKVLDKRLDKAIKDFEKNNTKRSKNKLDNVRNEYKTLLSLSNSIQNRINELLSSLEQCEEIQKDLENKTNYYNNLIADNTLKTLSINELKNRKNTIDKKLNGLNKLIDTLRNNLHKLFDLLKDITDIILLRNSQLEDFKKDNKYFISKNNENDLKTFLDYDKKGFINKPAKQLLSDFAKLRALLTDLENNLLNALEHGDINEEIYEIKKEELNRLIKKAIDYQNNIRYLEELINNIVLINFAEKEKLKIKQKEHAEKLKKQEIQNKIEEEKRKKEELERLAKLKQESTTDEDEDEEIPTETDEEQKERFIKEYEEKEKKLEQERIQKEIEEKERLEALERSAQTNSSTDKDINPLTLNGDIDKDKDQFLEKQKIDKEEKGHLIVDAATSIVYGSTRGYNIGVKGEFINTDDFNPNNQNQDILTTLINIGTPLYAKVIPTDTYRTTNTKTRQSEEKPILLHETQSEILVYQIIDGEEIPVGYVRHLDYIDENTTAPIKKFAPGVYDKDNISTQKAELEEIRKEIYNNSENGKHTELKVESKSTGFLHDTSEFQSLNSQNIKDDIELVVCKPEGFFLNNNESIDEETLSNKEEYLTLLKGDDFKGKVLVKVPAPNGKFMLCYSKSESFNSPSLEGIKNDIITVITAFVNNDENTLKEYNLSDSIDAINGYINNFVFTNKLDKSKFKLDVANVNGKNVVWIYDELATATNKSTLEEQEEAKKYVSQLSTKNVNSIPKILNRWFTDKKFNILINSMNSDNTVYITKDGTVQEVKYRSLVNENLKVNFKGNKITPSNGKEQTVYFHNPVLSFEVKEGVYAPVIEPSLSPIGGNVKKPIQNVTVIQAEIDKINVAREKELDFVITKFKEGLSAASISNKQSIDLLKSNSYADIARIHNFRGDEATLFINMYKAINDNYDAKIKDLGQSLKETPKISTEPISNNTGKDAGIEEERKRLKTILEKLEYRIPNSSGIIKLNKDGSFKEYGDYENGVWHKVTDDINVGSIKYDYVKVKKLYDTDIKLNDLVNSELSNDLISLKEKLGGLKELKKAFNGFTYDQIGTVGNLDRGIELFLKQAFQFNKLDGVEKAVKAIQQQSNVKPIQNVVIIPKLTPEQSEPTNLIADLMSGVGDTLKSEAELEKQKQAKEKNPTIVQATKKTFKPSTIKPNTESLPENTNIDEEKGHGSIPFEDDDVKEVIKFEPLVKDKDGKFALTAHKQRELLKFITLEFYEFYKKSKNKATPKQAIKNIQTLFEEALDQAEYFSTQEGIDEEYQNAKNDNVLAMGISSNVNKNIQLAKDFTTILQPEVFDQFIKKLPDELKLLGLKLKLEDNKVDTTTIPNNNEDKDPVNPNDSESGVDESTGEFKNESYVDGAVFEQSGFSKLGTKIKVLLSKIPNTKATFFNMPQYFDAETVFNELLHIFQKANFTFDSKLKALEELSKVRGKEYIKKVITLLNEADQQTKNQFVKVTNLVYAPKTIIYSTGKTEDIDSYKSNIFESNRNGYDVLIQEEWRNNNVDDRLYDIDLESGTFTVNQDYIKEVVTPLFDKFKESLTIEDVKSFLDSLGIVIPINIIEMLEQGLIANDEVTKKLIQFDTDWKGTIKESGLFTLIYKSFLKEKEILEDESVITSEQAFKKLARYTARFVENVTTNSSKSIAGNTNYDFIMPNRLTVRLKEILNNTDNIRTKLGNTLLGKNSYFLSLFKSSEKKSFAESISIHPLDGAKDGDKEGDAREFKDMTLPEQERLKLNLFINSNKTYGKGTHVARIITASKSDKSTGYDLEFVRPNNIFSVKDGIDKEALNILLNYVSSEYERYYSAQEYNKANPTKTIQSLFPQYNPENFYIFNFLNDVKELKDANGKLKAWTSKEVEPLIRKALIDHLDFIIKDQIELWEKYDVIQNGKIVVDKNYKSRLPSNNQTAIQQVATEYVITNYIGNFEYISLFSGDPAMTAKKDVEKTLAEYFKRLSKEISPFDIMNNILGNTYNSVTLQKVEVDIEDEVKKNWLDAGVSQEDVDAYDGIDIADAAEYVTLEERINILYSYGMLTDEDYKTISENIDHNGSTLRPYDYRELGLIFQPTKPIQVGSSFQSLGNGQHNFEQAVFIKSAEFVLVPQLIKGSKLQALDTFMRTNKLQRVPVSSAVKMGTKKMITLDQICDGKERPKLNALLKEGELTRDEYVNVLPRNYMGIQQATPYDVDKTKILEGSQLQKLILEGLEGVNKILADDVNKLHVDLMQSKYAKYLESVGIRDNKIADFKLLYSALIKYIKNNNKEFSPNDLQYLELNESGTGFAIKPYLTNQPQKIEALFTSMVTNDVIKQKLPGFSGILGSELGLFENWEDHGKVASGDIVKVGGWEFEDGLKPMRVEEGVVKPAQILVPAKFKLPSGQVIDISKMNIADIDTELLKLICYRIPTQGYNSMSFVEIVGFLPDYAGDLVIAPKAFIKQMGSDFDIDKLYIHMQNAKVEENGKVVVDNEGDKALENKIITTYQKILSLKEIFPKIIKPVDGGKLGKKGGIADDIDKLTPTDNRYSILTPFQQTKNYFKGTLAKSGVGKTSLLSTLNALFRNNRITLQEEIDGEYFPSTIKLMNELIKDLSKPLSVTGRPKADIICEIQAVVVDHIKELKADKINYNDYTHDVMAALAIMGADWEHIGYFLPQEVIKLYVDKLESIQNDTFIKDKEDDAYTNIKNHFTRLITEIDKQTGTQSKIYREVLEVDNNENFYQLHKSSGGKHNYFRNMLAYGLNKTKDNEKLRKYYIQQLAVLEDFNKYRVIGNDLFKVQMAINTSTKGIGKNFIETFDKQQKADELTKINSFSNLGNLFVGTPQGKAVEILTDINKVFGDLFPYGSPLVEKILKDIKDISPVRQNVEFKQQIFKFIRSFLYSKSTKLYGGKPITELRQDLLLDTSKNESLAKRWRTYLNENQDHFFAKRMFTKIKDGNAPSTIRFVNVSGGSREDDIQITIELISMLETGTDIEKQLAKDLIIYNFIIGGNQDAYNIIKYIPADYLLKSGFGNEIDIVWSDTSQSDNIVQQYVQHFPKTVKLNETQPNAVGGILEKECDKTSPLFISYQNKKNKTYNLFKKVLGKTGIFKYVSVPVLGYRGFLETDIISNPNSVISTNTHTSIGKQSIYKKQPYVKKVKEVKNITEVDTSKLKDTLNEPELKEPSLEDIQKALDETPSIVKKEPEFKEPNVNIPIHSFSALLSKKVNEVREDRSTITNQEVKDKIKSCE